MYTKNVKSKIFAGLSLISIILVVVLGLQENNVADLSFKQDAVSKLVGYSEPSGGASYLEALGLEYISLGSIFNYGVSSNVITYYFENLLNQELVSDEDTDILETVKSISTSEPDTTSKDYLALENIASINNTEYIDIEGNVIEDNEIMSIVVPKTMNADNIETTSNAWKFDYHLYKDSFIGVKKAVWYSQLFSETAVFDRAWTSLKWLCSDKIQCEILTDAEDSFTVLVYGGDEYSWYLTFDRYTGDVFELGKEVNYIEMSSVPLKEEDALQLLSNYGYVSELEAN